MVACVGNVFARIFQCFSCLKMHTLIRRDSCIDVILRDIRVDTFFGEVRFDNFNQNVGHDPTVPRLQEIFSDSNFPKYFQLLQPYRFRLHLYMEK